MLDEEGIINCNILLKNNWFSIWRLLESVCREAIENVASQLIKLAFCPR